MAKNQKMADKKKADYQEGLEKSRAGSAAWCRDSYIKDQEKSCAQSRESYMKDLEKSRADRAAWSCGSYKKDLAMIVLHGAVRESYLKDLEKSCARNCESYMKDPEMSHAVIVQHEAAKVMRKIWRRVVEM